MIGTLHATVLESASPAALAAFYQQILGGEVFTPSFDWVELVLPHGDPRLSFQLSPSHVPPVWPGDDGDLQVHLDIQVDDLAVAHEQLLKIGARAVARPGGAIDGFRVYLDPSGHPFCTVD